MPQLRLCSILDKILFQRPEPESRIADIVNFFSVNLDEHERKFTYYGTQLIKRRSRDLKRSIITVGELDNVPRTENNPHGLLIVNWRTLENKDLDY